MNNKHVVIILSSLILTTALKEVNNAKLLTTKRKKNSSPIQWLLFCYCYIQTSREIVLLFKQRFTRIMSLTTNITLRFIFNFNTQNCSSYHPPRRDGKYNDALLFRFTVKQVSKVRVSKE